MKSVVIYYFSGTGNTEIVANLLKDNFLQQNYEVDLIRIEDVLNNNLECNMSKYELVGIGCQVIGFGAPQIAYDFVRKLPKEYEKKTFIFRTSGGVAPINYNASKLLIKKLNKKGYGVFYERLFSIGSNWTKKFDDDIMKQLYEAAVRKVGIMVQELLSGKKRSLDTGIRLKILTGIISSSSLAALRLVGKDYVINKSCTNCGLCIISCPVKNIYQKNGKIKFKLSCNSCMRCVYLCPNNAINYRFLKSFPVPGGYNIKKILSQPYSDDIKANAEAPRFFKEYIKNDDL